MNKIKGWKAEHRIDKALNIIKKDVLLKFHLWKEAHQVNTALRQAKTYITSLRKENKELRNDFEQYVDSHDFLYKCLLSALKKNTTPDVYEKELNEIQKKLKEKYSYIFGGWK